MRAVTVDPSTPGSVALDEVDEPPGSDGDVLVATMAVGVCGTDREIIAGHHGETPAGRDRLVLGHESIGRVLEAPDGSRLSAGDLVVGIVRRPDPVPCPNCAVGEWDMCRNGRYTERGIKGRDGYLSERYRIHEDFAVPVPAALGEIGVLVEPTSVVAKAWEHIDAIGHRARWLPRKVLVTGAGPIGLLAALLGAQRGLDVHLLDRIDQGAKPALAAALGASYHTGDMVDACRDADVVIECTGVPQLVFDAMQHTAQDAIVCLTGVSSGGRPLQVQAGSIARELVLENDVVFGSVNANRRHYERAVAALQAADRSWLERLITTRVPLDEAERAYTDRDPAHDIKTIIEVGA